ncbi:hypothetical protein JCM10212_002975 [Sporobolomyces blumeae]
MVHLDSWINSLEPRQSSNGPKKSPLPPAPTLCHTLPEFSKLEQSAQSHARQAQRQHLIDEAVNSPLTLPTDARDPQGSAPPPSRLDSARSDAASAPAASRTQARRVKAAKTYEPWHVLKAIEKRDVMTLHEIKSTQFDLLVTGSPLPIVYAQRLGKSHHDVAILLVGALSRKVNDVTDDELAMMDPSTKATLRALRSSLKIAITASITGNDTSLIASFLQTIVMSEGNRWLVSSAQTLSLAFRSGPAAKPVSTAVSIMTKWVSRELQAQQVAAVGEYTANAVGDLCWLGLWSIVTDQVRDVEPVPLYFFARDDRILKAVEERIAVLRQRNLYSRLSAPLRSQLETALEVLGQRNVNGRERIEMLRQRLDLE